MLDLREDAADGGLLLGRSLDRPDPAIEPRQIQDLGFGPSHRLDDDVVPHATAIQKTTGDEVSKINISIYFCISVFDTISLSPS